ncbi:DUF2931 family protein [Pedobacter namyangjuensis]|uniref:DUF2931 family protein n=1 Tax=Pedobacter namyangjuensis TaxID=600626 RepID=UPI000DE1B990|nr:DUF2931 family protein [Pedobacter namyangjuensis]
MKINSVNKLLIGFGILIIAVIIYRVLTFKGWERYNYSATVTAPASFPISISTLYFTLENDDFESINSEDVSGFSAKWQSYYTSVDHAESQKLPSAIKLSYFSYRDQKFYNDSLQLPRGKIKQVFATASKNNQFLVLSQYAGIKKGLAFMVGIANDGNVVIWLRGVNLEQEVFRAKLKPKNPTPNDYFIHGRLTKDEYFKEAFKDLSDSVKTLFKNGYDEKANYIDSPSRYIENNKELWEYQKKNGFIE